jgi:hypothetical protein
MKNNSENTDKDSNINCQQCNDCVDCSNCIGLIETEAIEVAMINRRKFSWQNVSLIFVLSHSAYYKMAVMPSSLTDYSMRTLCSL